MYKSENLSFFSRTRSPLKKERGKVGVSYELLFSNLSFGFAISLIGNTGISIAATDARMVVQLFSNVEPIA
ncbi:MAG: hypothetical protein K9J16_07395 [Melioribacteraceae bacterium]|nr:hypothetical protein [Melioribacteraceae bacterium]MCF8353417.1 hypothetical protein [Melioribacteraceae bacterium]MCF8418978.1 hypothetical protein [Melioribacteraceae bacterium]